MLEVVAEEEEVEAAAEVLVEQEEWVVMAVREATAEEGEVEDLVLEAEAEVMVAVALVALD